LADLKYAGKTGVVCRFFDEPIYRQSFYTENVNEQDELIQHTNTDEIRESIQLIAEASQVETDEVIEF
jgi:hypothetical protein